MTVNHLVVFVKEPRLGRVKTRLAADIGAVAGWAFYRHTTSSVLRSVKGGNRWRRWLAVTPDSAARKPARWTRGWQCVPQGPGDLGERMTRILRRLPPGPVVIIGTDVPDISAVQVNEAFRALGRCSVVVGPSPDGGFWLVGLRRRPRTPDLFADVRWSTRFALGDTVTNSRHLRLGWLDVLEDIDDGAALGRWRDRRRSLQGSKNGIERTA